MSNQIDFINGPQKVFVDSFDFSSVYGGSLIYLGITSASEKNVFVLDISLAKKLSRGLMQAVDSFEKATGQKVDDRLDNDPVPSPLSNEMKPKG